MDEYNKTSSKDEEQVQFILIVINIKSDFLNLNKEITTELVCYKLEMCVDIVIVVPKLNFIDFMLPKQ